MNRAYSVLEIKAVDEDKRVITGIATTPEPDRVGDIVEPLGAKFKNPLPLLWQHQHDKPVGTAEFGKPTAKGIPFTATLPTIEDAGPLKDMVDMAWQSVKALLVRGVSIGFRAIEYSFMDNGGVRFSETEIMELSLVTIPANASATINSIKSIDTVSRAALGLKDDDDEIRRKSASPPGVTGNSKRPASGGFFYSRTKGKDMNIQEQIDALQAKRTEISDERLAIQTKAVGEGRGKDAAEQERFDEITAELAQFDKELSDLEELKKSVTVTPVNGQSSDDASQSRSAAVVSKAIRLKEAPGLMFARHAMVMYAAKNNVGVAAQIAADQFGEKCPVTRVLKAMGGRSIESVMKATVAAASTGDATWAGPLLEYNVYSGDFVEYLRPRTILGQFGANGIPSARRIPFNVHIKGQTSGGQSWWVGQGAPKPVTKFDYNDAYHGWFKVAALSVATDEMLRFSDPSIETLIRDGLADAGVERMNTDFIDPAFAGQANVSPASILNGITPTASSGTDADAVRADILALQAEADDTNNPLNEAVLIMHPKTAAVLASMRNALGQREFPNISRNGGEIDGIPVITSGYVPSDSSGYIVALVNASDIYFSDDGQATVDMSNQASIQMLDNPTNNSSTGTATSLVSMFQTDSTAFRMHRFTNWSRRRASSFAYLTGVNWGAGS